MGNKLVERNVLSVNKSKIGIQKDYEKWDVERTQSVESSPQVRNVHVDNPPQKAVRTLTHSVENPPQNSGQESTDYRRAKERKENLKKEKEILRRDSAPKPVSDINLKSEFYGLAEKLKLRILKNNQKAKVPVDMTKWAKEVDLMIRLDRRTEQEINQIINFSQDDYFWKSNILSMGKLREKFDQLWMKMNSGGTNGQAQRRITGYAAPTPGKYAEAEERNKSNSE